jgi:hypothetical protein
LGESVHQCKASTVVIDLSFSDGNWAECDRAMNKMFGADPLSGKGNKRAMKIKTMKPEGAAKVVLKLPPNCTMSEELRKVGFRVIGPVHTLADLLNADGPVVIGTEVIEKVFGSENALQWVQEAMAKAGKAPAKPLPEPAYWYEAFMRKEVHDGTDANPAA